MESKYKILVVDDDEKILYLIEDILLTSNFGSEIKKAKSEVEAYEAIKKSQFDIAIIDLKLGEKGDEGIDLTKKNKERLSKNFDDNNDSISIFGNGNIFFAT
jgi:Response regulator containing CheY-like receiver, AAA-type ATPase, and DNA-binding domains